MIRGTYFSELIESSVNLSEEYENYRMPRQLFTKGNKAAMWLLKQAFNLNTKALNGT